MQAKLAKIIEHPSSNQRVAYRIHIRIAWPDHVREMPNERYICEVDQQIQSIGSHLRNLKNLELHLFLKAVKTTSTTIEVEESFYSLLPQHLSLHPCKAPDIDIVVTRDGEKKVEAAPGVEAPLLQLGRADGVGEVESQDPVRHPRLCRPPTSPTPHLLSLSSSTASVNSR